MTANTTKAAADYVLAIGTPDVDDYRRLRHISGLSKMSLEAAMRGLPNTIHAVTIGWNGSVVGMGRIIGDGGCFYQVTDIAVDPDHQGRGLGKMIVKALVDYLRTSVPSTAYVSLIADGEASELYAQFGFVPTAPASIGMALKR
ncbi:GNAT family N-acetyltransferase [Arvimicrobium flavum]|uniref:GNAT family N-acetyltransferase n=1 Tax=Arvimicrobium flavum TaxID=3393320 RepID=UPI00237A73A7|nr:GNAT family N-acetyltransferase [Mesorhizobium shangrilense]